MKETYDVHRLVLIAARVYAVSATSVPFEYPRIRSINHPIGQLRQQFGTSWLPRARSSPGEQTLAGAAGAGAQNADDRGCQRRCDRAIDPIDDAAMAGNEVA